MESLSINSKDAVAVILSALFIWTPIGTADIKKKTDYKNVASDIEAINIATRSANPTMNMDKQSQPTAGALMAETPEEKNSDLWSKIYIVTITIGVAITAVGVAATMRQKYWSDKVSASQKTLSLSLALQLQNAQNNAKQIDTNLLNEQRLTSVERWRLRRVERAILPRSLFVNWPMLVAELKAGHFHPINIAYIDQGEPRSFAFDLLMALQKVGLNSNFIQLPKDLGQEVGGGGSGTMVLVANPEGDNLGLMLWQKFEIGGTSMPMAALPAVLSGIPKDANCLLITENGWAFSPGDGQAGEGVDEHGRPVPPP